MKVIFDCKLQACSKQRNQFAIDNNAHNLKKDTVTTRQTWCSVFGRSQDWMWGRVFKGGGLGEYWTETWAGQGVTGQNRMNDAALCRVRECKDESAKTNQEILGTQMSASKGKHGL